MKIWTTRDGSMALSSVGELVLFVNRPVVTDAAWPDFMEMIEEQWRIRPGRRLLTYSPKFAPSPSQIIEMLQRREHILSDFHHMALVTDSAVVRKVVNAVAWMVPAKLEIRAYHQERVWRALEWLVEGSDAELCKAREMMARLLTQCGYPVPSPADSTPPIA